MSTIRELAFAKAVGGSGGDIDPSICLVKFPATTTTLNNTTFLSPEELIVPNTITVFGPGICSGETDVKKVIVRDGVTEIQGGACYNCTNLAYVYIPASVTTIADNSFTNVTGVFDCGFAEGAVSGAPWGATNATINYNVSAPTM